MIIPNCHFIDYRDHSFLDCRTLAIYDWIINSHGTTPSPAVLLGIASGVIFSVFPLRILQIPIDFLIANGRVPSILPVLSRLFSIEIQKYFLPETGWQPVIEQLEFHHPVLLNLDSRFLQDPNFQIKSTTLSMVSSTSKTLVVGFYREHGELFFLVTNGKQFPLAPMPAKQLEIAMQSNIVPFQPDQCWYVLSRPPTIQIQYPQWAMSLHHFLQNMNNQGFAAIESCLHRLQEMQSWLATPDPKILLLVKQQLRLMGANAFRGSHTFYHAEYLQFLQELSQNIPHLISSNVLNEQKKLCELWGKIALLLGQAEKQANLSGYVNLLDALILAFSQALNQEKQTLDFIQEGLTHATPMDCYEKLTAQE